MKRIGIVSSFDVLCGNATYSEAVAKGLAKHYNVIKINVPISLQKNYDKNAVDQMLEEIRKCDYINIQMELGLYGPTPKLALKVLREIIRSCKSFSVTMHRVEEKPFNIIRDMFNVVRDKGIKSMLGYAFKRMKVQLLYDLYKVIVNEVVASNGSFIVHTRREAARLLKINNNSKFNVYPITWPEEKFPKKDIKHLFKNNYPVVGLFGFISKYKNYEIVAEGLKNENYNVLIAGGVHPQFSGYGGNSRDKNPSYIRYISNLFSVPEYENRLFSITAPSDSDLISYMQSVDIVCIPYLETGQSASGIASLAVQYAKRVVMTDNFCTHELITFLNRSPTLFDADSPIGLKSAINFEYLEQREIEFDGYNFIEMIDVYKGACENFPCLCN